jgi:hypothetical protein
MPRLGGKPIGEPIKPEVQVIALEGNYPFTSSASSSSDTLAFGGGITPGATGGATILTLNGSNIGENAISGVLAGNGALGDPLRKSNGLAWLTRLPERPVRSRRHQFRQLEQRCRL